MHCHIGIDIGTTNCKALVINEDGETVFTQSTPTPYIQMNGLSFFDLAKIDEFVDTAEAEATRLGRLISIGFSSIGESTVPVGTNGKALFNPPLWNEQEITADESESRIINRYNSFYNIGISQNGLLGLDKILWFRRHYPDIARRASWYLPLTSYQVFRKTGRVLWDYSQALRSNAFEVHDRKWNEALLHEFGLLPFGDVVPMGTNGGSKNGVCYGVGGHDHITGLYGIYSLLDTKNETFFYESMGTSAVLTMVVHGKEQDFPKLKSYNPPEGAFIPGFSDDSFIMTRSFRQFGALNSMWLKLAGLNPDAKTYRSLNEQILDRPYQGLSFLIECDSDFIRGNTKDKALNYYRFNSDAGLAECVRSTYLYLAVGAKKLEESLREVVGIEGPLRYFAGGAVTKDPLFMTMRATAVGHDIVCLNTSEISALGAVFVGLHAAGENSTIQKLKEKLLRDTVVYKPDAKFIDQICDAESEYMELQRKLLQGIRV
ncbi:MAG: hypothetical protein EOM48_02625 [Bacilli bacterium]|nr:hypothetical protein [Bacilli bacterium]